MSHQPKLPECISLEQQKKQARELLAQYKNHQPEAARRLRQQLYECAGLDDSSIFSQPLNLQRCQLVLAREHGFSSWTVFKNAIEAQTRQEDETTALREAIDRDDGEAVSRLVTANPQLLEQSVFDGGDEGYFAGYKPRALVYALQCGRVETVKTLLAARPSLACTPDAERQYPIDLIFKPYGSWLDGVAQRRQTLYYLLKEQGAVPNLEAATYAHDARYVLDALKADPAHIDYEREDFHWNLLVMAADTGCEAIVQGVLTQRPPNPEELALAIDRAAFGGQSAALQLLLPRAPQEVKDTALFGCGESLSLETARLLLAHGANAAGEVVLPGAYGDKAWGALAIALTTYSRKPWRGEFIDLIFSAGARTARPLRNKVSLDADGAVLSFFRGRFDLLETLIERNPALVHQRFAFDDEEWAVLTPIDGTTLLHLAMEYLDLPMAKWLVAHGADVNARAMGNDDRGHTPLFQAVRANAELYGPAGGTQTPESLTVWLLEQGADPNLRATICNRAGVVGSMQGKILRNVTPLEYLVAMSERTSRRKTAQSSLAQLLSGGSRNNLH